MFICCCPFCVPSSMRVFICGWCIASSLVLLIALHCITYLFLVWFVHTLLFWYLFFQCTLNQMHLLPASFPHEWRVRARVQSYLGVWVCLPIRKNNDFLHGNFAWLIFCCIQFEELLILLYKGLSSLFRSPLHYLIIIVYFLAVVNLTLIDLPGLTKVAVGILL